MVTSRLTAWIGRNLPRSSSLVWVFLAAPSSLLMVTCLFGRWLLRCPMRLLSLSKTKRSPPKLSLKSISGLRQFGPDYGGVTGKCLLQLKKVVFHDLSDLVKWVVEPNCHMFPGLESIDCSNCPNLCVMPFSECSCTNLCRLHIDGCPKLCLPPMPHTPTLTSYLVRVGSTELSYDDEGLVIDGYSGELAWDNLLK